MIGESYRKETRCIYCGKIIPIGIQCDNCSQKYRKTRKIHGESIVQTQMENYKIFSHPFDR